MIYSWRGGIEERFRDAVLFFLSAGDETNSPRAGTRSRTVCEKRRQKRAQKISNKKRRNTRNKDENQNLQIPKTENQKKTKKQTTNGEKSFSSNRLSDRPGSAHDSIPRHATFSISVRFSILLILRCRTTDHLFFYYFLFIAFLAKVEDSTADPTCKKSTYL